VARIRLAAHRTETDRMLAAVQPVRSDRRTPVAVACRTRVERAAAGQESRTLLLLVQANPGTVRLLAAGPLARHLRPPQIHMPDLRIDRASSSHPQQVQARLVADHMRHPG